MAEKTIEQMLNDVLNLKNASADVKKVVESLREVYGRLATYGGDKVVDLSKKIEALSKEATKTGTITDGLKDRFLELSKGATTALAGMTSSFNILTSVALTSQNALSALMGSFDKDSQGFNQNLAEMATKTAALVAAFSDMRAPKAFDIVGQQAREASAAYSDLLSGLGGIGDALSKAFEKGEYAKAFENKMTSMAAASGALEGLWGADILMGSSSNFDKVVEDNMNNMVMQTLGASNAMGITLQEGTKRNLEILGQLPEEMGRFYSINKGEGIGAMQLLSTVATGTGQEFGKTVDYAKKMYAGFQSTANGAMETFSLMSKVSTELKVSFEDISKTVTSINDGFKQWGDNSKDIIGIMREVTSALKEQGLGYEAGLEVTQALVGSIKQMGIEKKAFIAMSAGMGGTPLQAGLQVERMMQKGDVGEIANMLQETIGNIGGAGRVLNLEESANTPGMEAAFLAQRKVLEMFGISDTGVANRLMDVMSKIQIGEDIGNEGQKTLENAFKQGETIQDRQYNELTKISNNMDAAVRILSSFEAYDAQRTITGTGGVLGTSRQNRVDEQQKMLTDSTGAATPLAAYAVGKASDTKNALSAFTGDIMQGGEKIKEALGSLNINYNEAISAMGINTDRLQQVDKEEREKMRVTNSQNAESAGGYVIPAPPGAPNAPNAPGAVGAPRRSSILGIPIPSTDNNEGGLPFDSVVNAVQSLIGNNSTAGGQPVAGANHKITVEIDNEGVVSKVTQLVINSITGVIDMVTGNESKPMRN